MNYVQSLVSVVIGAVVAFAVLWLNDQNSYLDPIPGYALAVIVGGVVTLVVMWLMGRSGQQGGMTT